MIVDLLLNGDWTHRLEQFYSFLREDVLQFFSADGLVELLKFANMGHQSYLVIIKQIISDICLFYLNYHLI